MGCSLSQCSKRTIETGELTLLYASIGKSGVSSFCCQKLLFSSMMRKQYSSAFKAKVVQEILKEEKTLVQIASGLPCNPVFKS
jgi:hypothetical protein